MNTNVAAEAATEAEKATRKDDGKKSALEAAEQATRR